MTGLRIGSVCSGYEGLGMAVQAVLGGELAWVADNDPGASKILAHHFPDVPNLGDITETDWGAVEPVDVFTGGFPCTDISYAGPGDGILEGNRSGLWYTIADAIGVLRPGLVILENVAGIVARRPGLDVVLGSLAALGFDAQWLCLRASDIGACHARDRWFCVARPAEDADGSAGSEWRQPASGQASGRRARADAGRPDRAHAPDQHDGQERETTERGGRELAAHAQRHGLEGRQRAPGPRQGGRAATDCGRLGSAGSDLPPGFWGPYEPAIRRWERVFGRPAPVPVEPGRTGQRLSPRFEEWMMGLPDGWVTDVPGLDRKQMVHAIGNGVVPPQAELALRLLLAEATGIRVISVRGAA